MMKKNPAHTRKGSARSKPPSAKPVSRGAKAESHAYWTAAIFLGALAVRVVYLVQIRSIPLFYHLAGDGRSYDEWAQRIAAGDWLGQGVFYQAPLYPYFLGILELLAGHNLWFIRFVQITMGALSCVLVYLVGRKLFSRAAGIAAGCILAGYAPAIFFDGLIDKSILDLFLLSLLLLLLTRAMERRRWAEWLAAGVVLGLFGLSRENALIFAAVVPVWIAIFFSTDPVRIRAQWVGVFVAGIAVVLIPVGLRNLAQGGEFKLTTSQFGANFFIGNNPAADGTYGSVHKIIGEPQLEGKDATRLAERISGRKLTPGQVSDFWFEKSLDYIRSAPLNWFGLLGKKWLMVWNAREVEDSDDLYVYRQWSSLLSVLSRVSHFGLLVPLAAAGIWLTRKQWRRLWLLYAMIIFFALSVSVFYVFGRYRFPLVPLLVVFGGVAIAELGTVYRQHSWRSLPAVLVIVLMTAVIVNWPIYGVSGPGAAGYNNLSNAYYKQGRVSEAITTARKAIELQPDLGVADYNLGNLYAGQGQFDLAKRYFERAMAIYPNYAEVRSNYGQLIAEHGDLETGIRYFRQAIELNPSIGRAHLDLGVALAKQGRLDEAIEPLRRAAQLEPDAPEPSYYLGSVFAAQNRYADAAAAFEQALRIRPDFVPAHQSLAQLLLLEGKKDEAMEHYQEAVRLIRRAPRPTAGTTPARP